MMFSVELRNTWSHQEVQKKLQSRVSFMFCIFSKNLYFIYSFYVFKKRMYDSLIGDQLHAVSQFVLRVAFVCIDPNLSLWQYFPLRIRQLNLNISVCLANVFF